jgi:Nuclease-related domain
MTATVEVFWGEEPRERSEREFLAQLQADLASQNISAIILANFFTNSHSRQVDFLVITDNHVCHVELKNYTGTLLGSTNGPWSSLRGDGSSEVIDRKNPYAQAFSCKMAISDDMHAIASQDSAVPRPPGAGKFYSRIDSIVCVFPRLADGSRCQATTR